MVKAVKLPRPSEWQDTQSPGYQLRNIFATHRFLAVDTETTGGNFFRAYPGFEKVCMPFMVTCCDQDGNERLWEWDVDPSTRRVKYCDTAAGRKLVRDMLKHLKRYPVHVFHNAKFDMHALRIMAEECRNAENPVVWYIEELFDWAHIQDTLGAAHVLDSLEDHGLKGLALKYLNIPEDDEDRLKELVVIARRQAKAEGIPVGPGTTDEAQAGTDYWLPRHMGLDVEACSAYGAMDARRTALLWLLFAKQLKKQDLGAHYQRERELLACVYEMECNGVPMRPQNLSRQKALFTQQLDNAQAQIYDIVGYEFNINSTAKQLPQALYVDLDARCFKTTAKKGAPSCDKEAIALCLDFYDEIHLRGRISYDEWTIINGKAPSTKVKFRKKDNTTALPPQMAAKIERIVRFCLALTNYAKANTALGYLKSYHSRRTGYGNSYYLHGSFNPWATNTTRFSATNPNLQNISKDENSPLRSCFGPAPGTTWYAMDYNQLELRLMAHASGDETLTTILLQDQDRHQITCDAINKTRARLGLANISRKMAKNINFAWQYGASSKKLSRMAGIPAADFDNAMREAYPGVVQFMQDSIDMVRKQGYVETMFGYRLYVEQNAPYKGTNYRVQGSAGDLTKNAMISMRQYIRDNDLTTDYKIILTIHDEIVVQVKKGTNQVHVRALRQIMEDASKPIGCYTPVNVKKIDTNWNSGTDIQLHPLAT